MTAGLVPYECGKCGATPSAEELKPSLLAHGWARAADSASGATIAFYCPAHAALAQRPHDRRAVEEAAAIQLLLTKT